MKFIIFVIDSRSNTASGNEMEAIDAFNDELQANNYWVMAAGINNPDHASLIDNRNGAHIVNSGSLFDASEHYSGFWIIDVPSEEIAANLALQGSQACNRKVELRPFLGQ
jgi:hypothetical protein